MCFLFEKASIFLQKRQAFAKTYFLNELFRNEPVVKLINLEGGVYMTKFFKLKENNTTVSTEIFAGITTFMTMAYILAVNPSILGDAGMNPNAVFTATALAAVVGTLCMAFFSNYPFVLAPGMGINAYFAYTVAAKYGWEIALCAVFTEGIIFILISTVNVREAIFAAIPKNLKFAVSAGIGLFIAFTGLKTAGVIISNESTLLALGDISSVGPCLTILGLIIIGVMYHYKVKGALLWGILITYILGIGCELVGIYVPSETNPSLIPESIISLPPSIADINIFTAFESVDFNVIDIFDFIVVLCSFLFVDMFDTVGTLVGVSEKAGFCDKDGKLPKLKQALLADAVGTVAGAVFGTSTTTTYVESASGVAQGGRTGLTAVTSAVMFAVALLFSPIFIAIPSFATAPALIIVGLFMLESVLKIDFSDYTESIPSFLAIIMMPFTNSIAEGLVFGVLSYVILKLLAGKRKDVTLVMFIIACIFFVKLFL